MQRSTPRSLGPDDGPLWARIEADLRSRIEAGEFRSGFPGEHALAAEYEVSRQTVRQALRRLREERLVSAERGRTPRVTADGVLEQPVGALYSLFASVESAGRSQRSITRVLEVRRDPMVAAALQLPSQAPLTYLERVRLADDEPMALDHVWLPAEGTEPLLHVDFGHTALYAELRQRCGVRISGGREQIRSVLADHAQAELLGVAQPAALTYIERTGLVAGRPFEHRRTFVRSDRFALTADFSARDGYQLR